MKVQSEGKINQNIKVQGY